MFLCTLRLFPKIRRKKLIFLKEWLFFTVVEQIKNIKLFELCYQHIFLVYLQVLLHLYIKYDDRPSKEEPRSYCLIQRSSPQNSG